MSNKLSDTYTAKHFVHMEELLPLFRECLSAGQKVKFSPRGVSMLPMLRQGRDTVTLSPVTGQLKKYDLPLYRRDDGKFVLHRIVAVGENYTCVGDNQFDLEKNVRQDQIIAVVTSFTRDEREIPVTDPVYQCYCRLRHWSRWPRRKWRGLKRRLYRLVRRKNR